jgi:hypothetical protein
MVGGQFIAWILTATGFGMPVALALDAAQSAAIAYAVGAAAKCYFKGQQSRGDIRAVMRQAMAEANPMTSTRSDPHV